QQPARPQGAQLVPPRQEPQRAPQQPVPPRGARPVRPPVDRRPVRPPVDRRPVVVRAPGRRTRRPAERLVARRAQRVTVASSPCSKCKTLSTPTVLAATTTLPRRAD